MMLKKETVKGMILGAVVTLGAVAAVGTVSAGEVFKKVEVSYRNVQVNIEGNNADFKDEKGNRVEPLLIDGTTYVPLRGLAEHLGVLVKWDKSANTAYIDKDEPVSDEITYMSGEKIKNSKLEEAIIRELDADQADVKKTRYLYNHIDLNGDKQDEVFVQLVGPYTSGTGGDTGMLFRQKDGGYELIQSFTLVRNPVIVSTNRTNGWNDLIVEVSGGGVEAKKVKLQFNGKTYPNIPDGVELAKSEKIQGTEILYNDNTENTEQGSGLYLK